MTQSVEINRYNFAIVMVDFNAGPRKRDEIKIGNFNYGTRNERGDN